MDNKRIINIQQWALFEFILSIGMMGYGIYWYFTHTTLNASTETPWEMLLVMAAILIRTILLFRASIGDTTEDEDGEVEKKVTHKDNSNVWK